MSKKESNHQVLEEPKTAGDISIIRNILMGQQMSSYKEQFDQLNNRLDLMEESFKTQLKNLDQVTVERSQNLEKEMNSNFRQLEKLITDNVLSLEKKLEKVSNEDKKRLGKMMGDLSKKLIGE